MSYKKIHFRCESKIKLSMFVDIVIDRKKNRFNSIKTIC